MKVTFVLRGLPPNCYPVLEICGMKYTVNNYYQGEYVLELTFNCSWRARRVNCNGILYALWICSIFLRDYIKLTFNSTADLEFILKK
jgi:hypothetical protein